MTTSHFYRGLHVTVTGGAGFVGSHLVEALLHCGANVVVLSRDPAKARATANWLDGVETRAADLSSVESAADAMAGADLVFNLAADVAGIGYQVNHPGSLFYANATLNLNAMEAARLAGVERYICTSSTCVYRREAPIPTSEPEGFVDDPEPTSEGYGWAKRVAELQARFYAREYGMQIAIVRPANIYGPRDNFDPDTSHVIPGLITRAFEEDSPCLEVWGSGSQTRSFLYVEDAVSGMMAAAENYAVADPLNLASPEEVTIGQLASHVLNAGGIDKQVRFLTDRPEGQARKAASHKKALILIDWQANYSLHDGLKKTIEWYRSIRQISSQQIRSRTSG